MSRVIPASGLPLSASGIRSLNLGRKTMNYGHGYSPKNKYNNQKSNGFDSKREERRYKQLLLMEKAGEITDLQRQVKFVLIPAQREFCSEIYSKGRNKGRFKPGKIIEREVAYYADFVYTDVNSNRMVVEDAKGMRTPEYVIKRKMMLKEYGIRIREV